MSDAAAAIERIYREEYGRLRLIFTCRHPALAPEARVALTRRRVSLAPG